MLLLRSYLAVRERFFFFFFSFYMAHTSPTSPAQAPVAVPTPTPPKSDGTPIAVFRFGSVSAAVFPKAPSGRAGKSFSISLRRSYRTAEGTWERLQSLRPVDLPLAILALQKCYESLTAREGSAD
jgi:hypothetical protein